MEAESHGNSSPSSAVPTANPLSVDEGMEDPSVTLQQTEEVEDLLSQTATCFTDHDEAVRREDVLKGDEVEEESLLQVSEAPVQPEVCRTCIYF